MDRRRRGRRRRLTTTIELQELGEPVVRELTAEQASALTSSNVASLAYIGPGRFAVSASTKVGVCAVGDLVVRIRPKVDIARVFYLLGFGRKPGWRPETVTFDSVTDLVTAIATAFVMQAERAIEQGLLQGYVERDDDLAVLRGRMRDTEQMSRRFGLAVPLLVRFDDYTTDTPENRLLRGAAERLLKLPSLPGDIRRSLRSLRLLLADVSPLQRGVPLPTWRPNRLNARYRVALWLADVVLRNNALDHADGAIRANGFILDMAKLFEDFVTDRLASALTQHGGGTALQDRHYLDAGEGVLLRPDLVWYQDNRKTLPIAVVDAKYKAEKPSGFPNADVYQLLAYCTALRLPVGHLVYAKGNDQETTCMIRNAGVKVVAHSLDLDVSADHLEAQISGIAHQIASLSATSRQSAS